MFSALDDGVMTVGSRAIARVNRRLTCLAWLFAFLVLGEGLVIAWLVRRPSPAVMEAVIGEFHEIRVNRVVCLKPDGSVGAVLGQIPSPGRESVWHGLRLSGGGSSVANFCFDADSAAVLTLGGFAVVCENGKSSLSLGTDRRNLVQFVSPVDGPPTVWIGGQSEIPQK